MCGRSRAYATRRPRSRKTRALTGRRAANYNGTMSTPPDRAASTRLTDLHPVGGSLPGFTVLGELGKGGMGTVFLAEDSTLKRKVALKTMRPEYAAAPLDRERFLREARAAAAVEHDNIVPVLHVGEAVDGTPFIVMPLLKGESLDARLKRDPVAPLELLVRVGRDVCAALAAAHAAGLVHRDIKPANIWLEGDPAAANPVERVRRCKVLDFGLARVATAADGQLTGSGIVGTPAYMPPEQARGEPADARADLYSLGATLYRMATGCLPFEAPTPMALLLAIALKAPPPVREFAPHLPPELADLIDRMLSKDRAQRPQSAAEVEAALADVLVPSASHDTQVQPCVAPFAPAPNPLSTSAPQLLSARTGAPPAGRSRLPLVALVVCVLGLVPLVLWAAGAFRPKEHPDRAAALYAFSLGGCVTVNDEEGKIVSEAGLPKGPFRLNAFSLLDHTRVTDDRLAPLAGCKHLYTIGLSYSDAGDDLLKRLAGSDSLHYVYMEGTKVTSEGVRHVASCFYLAELNLSGTDVDDTGLAHLHKCENLHYLYLNGTFVTEGGVRAFQKLRPECKVEYRSLRTKK
jgi:serine/threonine protein kinase